MTQEKRESDFSPHGFTHSKGAVKDGQSEKSQYGKERQIGIFSVNKHSSILDRREEIDEDSREIRPALAELGIQPKQRREARDRRGEVSRAHGGHAAFEPDRGVHHVHRELIITRPLANRLQPPYSVEYTQKNRSGRSRSCLTCASRGQNDDWTVPTLAPITAGFSAVLRSDTPSRAFRPSPSRGLRAIHEVETWKRRVGRLRLCVR